MLICDVLQNVVNDKLHKNDVTVKLVPTTSCLFDMLDVHKNHRQHQAYQRTVSVGNEKNFIAKMQIISSHIIFLITLTAQIDFANQQLKDC